MVAKGYPFSNQIYVSSADRSAVAVQEAAFAERRVCNDKNFEEKALIPLPPTGLTSFFCANPDVAQTNLQPRRALGLYSRSSIAQNAKFCREMKRVCTAARGAFTDGVLLECPIPLGKNFENVRFCGFIKTRTVFFCGGGAGCVERLNLLQVTSGGDCGVFSRLHRTEHDRVSVFLYCDRSRHDEKSRFNEIDS